MPETRALPCLRAKRVPISYKLGQCRNARDTSAALTTTMLFLTLVFVRRTRVPFHPASPLWSPRRHYGKARRPPFPATQARNRRTKLNPIRCVGIGLLTGDDLSDVGPQTWLSQYRDHDDDGDRPEVADEGRNTVQASCEPGSCWLSCRGQNQKETTTWT